MSCPCPHHTPIIHDYTENNSIELNSTQSTTINLCWLLRFWIFICPLDKMLMIWVMENWDSTGTIRIQQSEFTMATCMSMWSVITHQLPLRRTNCRERIVAEIWDVRIQLYWSGFRRRKKYIQNIRMAIITARKLYFVYYLMLCGVAYAVWLFHKYCIIKCNGIVNSRLYLRLIYEMATQWKHEQKSPDKIY